MSKLFHMPRAVRGLLVTLLLLLPQAAHAQTGNQVANPIVMVIVLGALALAPFVIVMLTSFVKISVVLSILRNALGTQQVPPNQIITGLAFVLTIFIGGVFASALQADDTLARFKGGIGVHPVSNATGVADGLNFPTVTKNVVRGINPAGQLWVIEDLDARVKTNGDIDVRGSSGQRLGNCAIRRGATRRWLLDARR